MDRVTCLIFYQFDGRIEQLAGLFISVSAFGILFLLLHFAGMMLFLL